jgi:hypothetical protein
MQPLADVFQARHRYHGLSSRPAKALEGTTFRGRCFDPRANGARLLFDNKKRPAIIHELKRIVANETSDTAGGAVRNPRSMGDFVQSAPSTA